MKKILQYGFSSNRGGIEVVGLNIHKNIDKNKYSFDYIIADEEMAFEKEINELGGNIYKLTPKKKNLIKYYKDFISFFREKAKEYEAIHCSYCSLYDIFPVFLAKVYGIPKIIIHAHCSNVNSNKLRVRTKLIINKILVNMFATDFIAVSELSARFMFTKNRVQSKNYKIFRNPLHLEKFKYNVKKREFVRKELGIDNYLVIGHVGVFSTVKNHEFLLKVFYEIQKKYDKSVLILLGGGSLVSSISEQANNLNIKEKIIFAGNVNNPHDYMQAMDIFIFPSLYEGFGNVLIEAQASGLPCYASDTIPYEVKVTNLIQFISLQSPAEIWADKILKSYTNLREDRYMEVNQQGFSIKECIKAYEDLYAK